MNVTVYTKPACPQCNATKKELNKLGISYVEVEIDDEIRAAAIELGITSAPIVCANVNGVELPLWGGFRPGKIQALRSAA